jgi:hypothetical protein
MSKRTKMQCRAPAEVGHAVCRFHGSRSRGAKTREGQLRSAAGRVKHGESTDAARQKSSEQTALIRALEDSLHLLGVANGPKMRGRKPVTFKAILTHQDILDLITGNDMESYSPVPKG